MTDHEQFLDYDFQDKNLKEIAELLRFTIGKRVLNNKIVEMQRVIIKIETDLTAIRKSRIEYVGTISELKSEQKELDDKVNREGSDETVKKKNMHSWLGMIGVGIITFVVTLDAGWFGLFAFIMAIISGVVAFSIIDFFFVTPRYVAEKDKHLLTLQDEQEANREDQFTHDGILTGEAFQRELTKIRCVLLGMKESLSSGVVEYMKNKQNAVEELIEICYLDGKIDVDEHDPDTRGCPVIRWNTPNMAMPEISNSGELTAEQMRKAGSVRFGNLVQQETMAITVSIYVNEGRMIDQDFDQHCEKIYSDTLAHEGQFTHLAAQVGKTLNYYIVSRIEYLGYRKEGEKMTAYRETSEIIAMQEQIKIKAFQSDEEILEAEIKDHTTKAKRAKFHEKIGKAEQGTETSPADRKKQLVEKKIAEHKLKQEIEKNTLELRQTLTDAGLPEEEIEEAIEEFLQSM